MKKLLLYAGLLIGGLSQLNAQCVIVPSCAMGSFGYCTSPAENTNLPNATEAAPYSTTIQISIGSSVGGFATIQSATLTSVTGMPAGLNYSVNPSSGVVVANSDACVLIAGTPTAPGSYTITANVAITTDVGSFPPATVSWYLIVDPAGSVGIKSYNTATNFFLAPNPATSELMVSAAFNFGKISIIDALGKTVMTHDANNSTLTKIDINDLSKGVYFLQMNDGNRMVTRKFIKD